MASPILHWIIDPICGWSYGALPLINAIEEGFPTVVFENQHAEIGQLPIHGFYNKPQDLVRFVEQQLLKTSFNSKER